jgi:hypothetical protein
MLKAMSVRRETRRQVAKKESVWAVLRGRFQVAKLVGWWERVSEFGGRW